MAIRDIKKYPDEILRKKAEPVESFTAELDKLIEDMIETMYFASGIGLAAPQVAESKRLIVIDTSWENNGNPSQIVLINPEIVECHGSIESEEGCLSIPNYRATLKRNASLLVKGYDRQMRPIELECEGLLARVIQHEIDHLNGILFLDHLSLIKRELLKKRYLKSLSK
ncbi:MAG: peptide deformylase [Thermodesulfovibrionales bacterium]|nr:peptide deformylase [Thermodesulfovibrionales bacterium]